MIRNPGVLRSVCAAKNRAYPSGHQTTCDCNLDQLLDRWEFWHRDPAHALPGRAP